MPRTKDHIHYGPQRPWRCGLWLVLAVAISSPGVAQDADCNVERDVPGHALDEVTYRQLNDVYEAFGEDNFDEAYQGLQRMMARAGRDEYLMAVLHQAMAQVEWSRENFDSALTQFEKAVALDVLPNHAHFALMYQIAQLYAMQERYDEALERLQLWFCTAPEENITSDAYAFKASIYASKKDYVNTLEAIDTAISMEQEPREPWYMLKLGSHYELEQFPQAAQTLEIMVLHWPDKKEYWVQLSQIYYKLKRESRALAVLALAYRKNLLDTEGDIIYLSNLYSGAAVPYKAAEVLERGIEDGLVEANRRHWTRVAEEWYTAEELEKSLVAYEKAGAVSSDGKIDLRRGYILVDLERWAEAKQALDAALSKGGIEDRQMGEAYLLRGMAEFNLGNFDSASSDWGRASRYDRTRSAAEEWIAHLREGRR